MPGLDSLQSFRPDNIVRETRIGSFTPLLQVPSAAGVNAGLKRALDVLAAASMLVLLAPVFLLLAALVRRDGGAAFYAHTRVGQGGRGFGCLIDTDNRIGTRLVLDDDRLPQNRSEEHTSELQSPDVHH
jgi:hypothetical protein